MNSTRYDIVILPADELTKKAIVVGTELGRFDTVFTLNEITGPFPHISLYMAQLKEVDLERARAILSDIAKNIQPLNLIATRYNQDDGYIDADYTRSVALDRLQMTVIKAINPIRDGAREKDKIRMLETTGKVRENLEQYGYRDVGELFRPHMTFTRFGSDKAIDTEPLPALSEFSGHFISIGLFEMGDNGTCMKSVAEFKFSDLGVPSTR